MKITLTKPLGGHDKGDTIDVPDAIAERLIKREVATSDGDSDTTGDDGYPEGEPTEKWSAKQLDAYANDHDINLAGITKKADKAARILEVITAPQA